MKYLDLILFFTGSCCFIAGCAVSAMQRAGIL